MPTILITHALDLIRDDVESLLTVEPVPLGLAKPPDGLGVYMLLVDGAVMYVGQAKGKKGLRDRLLGKHLSGDESHAMQRAYQIEFPDRKTRRAHMKTTVFARWLTINDPGRVSAVERVLIWLYDPSWNKD